MTQFQVRISGEAAYYLRMLKEKYETSEGINITKATILTRAFQNSKTVTNWTKVVQDNSISLKNIYPVEEKELKLNVALSDEVAEGIKKYKEILPSATNTQSVTLGVCVKFLLKAELMTQLNHDISEPEKDFDKKFSILEKQLLEIVAPVNHKLLSDTIWNFKNNFMK